MTESELQEATLPKYEESSSDMLRDRIVILGRQAAGKTVYLSLLYELLWKSNGDLNMKAIHGKHHREFIRTAMKLRQGQWPASTIGNRTTYIEIKYKGLDRLMVAMDYSGELINKAFVSEEDTDEVQGLLNHLDHAAGVMLLVDPADVTGHSASFDSTVENDFGIVQAMERLRKWPGGTDVPLVLVLTKVDETGRLLKKYGGTGTFCQKFFPKLIHTVTNLKVCTVSAVQTINNSREIKSGFVPTNLETPLRYCLDMISESEKFAVREKMQKLNIQKMKRQIKRDRIISWCIITVIAAAIAILVYYVLTIIWPDLLDKWILGS